MTSASLKTESFTLEEREGVAIVTFDMPGKKVNTLNSALNPQFEQIFAHLEKTKSIQAVVLRSGKKDCFVAGADIEELQAAPDAATIHALSRGGQKLLGKLDALNKPVVAAISGSCLGGGLELALACDYRIASDSPKTQLGLPEVMLGLIPGAGGTQRLPRLVGIEAALNMMLQGNQVTARKALRMGLVDYVALTDNLEEIAVQAAKRLAAGKLKRRIKKRPALMQALEANALGRSFIFSQALKAVLKKTKGLYPAPKAIIEAAAYGLNHGIDKGLEKEAEEFARMSQTPESKGLISLYFGQNELKKNRYGKPKEELSTIGVLGAGLMGSGIGLVSIQKGFQVRLKDVSDESLGKGKKYVWDALAERVKRGSMSSFEAQRTMSRLSTQLDLNQFNKCSLVIEAVFEDLNLKHRVLAEVEAQMPSTGVFASNTSALPIKSIAAKAKRPENVLGMHYFSPVHKMPLLEIIVTDKTAKEAAAVAVEVGIKQGKTVIVVNDGPGFYTTRVLTALTDEAAVLVLQGVGMHKLDRAMQEFGFPVGPITLIDEVGIDVAAHIAHDLGAAFGKRLCSGKPELLEEMVAAKALGRKSGNGFYLYQERKVSPLGKLLGQGKGPKVVNPIAMTLLEKYKGSGDEEISVMEMQKRLAFRMVNEATYCLQENILMNPTDGDIGAVFGLGFPPFFGGPFRYVDSLGIGAFVDGLKRYEEKYGERFAASAVLKDMAKQNKRFYA